MRTQLSFGEVLRLFGLMTTEEYVELAYDAGVNDIFAYPLAVVEQRAPGTILTDLKLSDQHIEKRVPGPLRLDKPIALITEDNHFLDGAHRICKAIRSGVSLVPVVVLKRDPGDLRGIWDRLPVCDFKFQIPPAGGAKKLYSQYGKWLYASRRRFVLWCPQCGVKQICTSQPDEDYYDEEFRLNFDTEVGRDDIRRPIVRLYPVFVCLRCALECQAVLHGKEVHQLPGGDDFLSEM
jgi:hypothetical protein